MAKRLVLDRLATTVFDTRQMPAQDRFTAWESSIGVVFDPSLDDRTDPLTFNARVEAAMFGQVFMGRVVSCTQAFSRPQSKILLDGLDAYLVQVFRAGTCEVQDGRHTRIVRPGDIYIIDASAPLEAIDFSFDHITTFIPRDLIDRNLVNPDGHHRRVIPGHMPLAKLLYAFICGLNANQTDMTVYDGLAAVAPLLSLTEGLLNAKVPGAAGQQDPLAVEFAVLNTVKDHIESNLGERGLTPDSVAAAMGMSRSRLYRLFEPLGGVSRYIKQRRLRRSLQGLLDQGHQHLRISEIAWRWGFGSESDYSRAFKQRYGTSPSEARSARSRAISQTSTETASYERWIADIAT